MGPKETRQANTTRKNLLGRTVSVERKQQGNEPASKTRTVISKNGGVVSTKTSYKDGNSIAGKMRSNKIDKIIRKSNVKPIDKAFEKLAGKAARKIVKKIKMGSKPR